MLTHQSEESTQQIEAIPSPDTHTSYGDVLGILLVALTVLAKDFLTRRGRADARNEDDNDKDEIISILKDEIAKRDELIARLQNEIILTRKTMDFSGEFAPPVSQRRVVEVSHDNSRIYDREDC